jgi:beta-carotene hydroxylase
MRFIPSDENFGGEMISLHEKKIDWKSLFVSFSMIFGLMILFYLSIKNAGNPWVLLLLATLMMNLSFTAWHEASHGNLSKSNFLNEVVGIVSSIFSAYPGYYARKREHLAHHRFEGIEGKDPVFERIQVSFLLFPFHLFKVILGSKGRIPPEFLPMQKHQKWIDRFSILSFLGFGVFCFIAGYGSSFLLIFLIPRAVVFWLHVFYICYFPHAVRDGKGYQKYRIISESKILYWFTMGQSLHGIHHYNSKIPWHRYVEYLSEAKENPQFAEKELT